LAEEKKDSAVPGIEPSSGSSVAFLHSPNLTATLFTVLFCRWLAMFKAPNYAGALVLFFDPEVRGESPRLP
jgi:hypothetical protein